MKKLLLLIVTLTCLLTSNIAFAEEVSEPKPGAMLDIRNPR